MTRVSGSTHTNSKLIQRTSKIQEKGASGIQFSHYFTLNKGFSCNRMVKPKFESVKVEGDEKVSSGEETGQVEDDEDFIPLEDEAVMLIGGKKPSF